MIGDPRSLQETRVAIQMRWTATVRKPDSLQNSSHRHYEHQRNGLNTKTSQNLRNIYKFFTKF